MWAADRIETLMYGLEEYELGNKGFKGVIDWCIKQLRDSELESVNELIKELSHRN